MAEKLIFERVVDKSALLEGITIPEAYHDTLYSHLGRRLQHGETMQIQVKFNGTDYPVLLKNQAFDSTKYSSHHDIVQIRYSRKSPIATALQNTFTETNKKLNPQKCAATVQGRIKIPANEQEYIMVYAADEHAKVMLEPIRISDIRQEMDQLSSMPETVIEGLFSSDDSAGIEERIRISRIRKMNRDIGNALKKLYGFRCQICGAFIGENYGSTLVHAHHINYFSRSMNNDASNIMIVCPNHHGIIHDMNPEFNSANKTYKYPNGYIEGLVINKHI